MANISRPTDAFAIVLNDPNPDYIADIKSKYPNHYEIADNCILVADELILGANASSVSDRIEMDGDHMGIVLKLNGSYSGYNYKTLWDWINSVK